MFVCKGPKNHNAYKNLVHILFCKGEICANIIN